MIDVPVRVKDALREGNMRKNYRFVYSMQGDGYSLINQIAYNNTLSLADPGTYKVSINDIDSTFSISVTTTSTSEVVEYTGTTTIYDTYVEFSISEASTLAITQIHDNTLSISVELFMNDSLITRTIDNGSLVKESVKIDERMCTGNDLKFGLCEGSSLEFQYFNHPNINGKDVDVYIDVQYVDENGVITWHTIPMGRFTVDQCPMQFSTGIYKALAYNKLKSSYLDTKMNTVLDALYTTDATVTMFDIQKQMCDGFEVIDDRYKYLDWQTSGIWDVSKNYLLFCDSCYMTQDYGINTPINPLNCPELIFEDPLYIGVETAAFSYGIYYPYLPSQYTYASPNGSIIEIEKLVVQYIKDFVDKAKLSITGQQAIDYLCSHGGFQYVFGIAVTKNSGSTFTFYSTVQWNYEVEHGIVHTVAGTLSDLNGVQIHSTSTNDVYTYLLCPHSIFAEHRQTAATTNPTYRILFSGLDRHKYTHSYWSDSGKEESLVSANDVFVFPNGGKFMDASQTPYYSKFFYVAKIQNLSDADNISAKISDLPEFTLRDILTATYELNCQYGKLDRETDLFSGVELNNSHLVPADTLYPGNSLYPGGNSLRSDASMYQKLWTDSQGVQTFRYLIITYKTTENGQEVEKTLQRTVNADGTTDYNMSDNWLFKNLVWTESDVGDYADTMVLKMQNVSWFPFEMWCAGLPYIETGDELEITNSEGTYTSYVLQRQLNGIQNLQDTYIDGELDIF